MTDCRLYLITPPVLDDLAAFGRTLAEALDAGDVAALQLRLKDQPEAVIAAAHDVIAPLCLSREVALILNDDPKLAAKLGCDGVHIGQSDMALDQARKIMGKTAMIGVTCHDSRHLAMEAAEGGADYVAFGAFYPTATKETLYRPEPEILTIWQETMEIPCVAIGGITAENAGPLAAAGADFVAVSGGVWGHPDGPTAAVKAINAAISG
ncbi:thiamine phosphate synthase [Caulobacter sp. SLTY]|uniref:thiamine phosphate synthase n=1 Tax=Caulobacter sp. SLTY TaxID=2683262 RepID=UPI0014133550|nr:thiamine phosphate synthase [Caulobacter sp. SLTY]NBB16542.1 thiamine phosphate synthase [Caulobacter sp. SLTY]